MSDNKDATKKEVDPELDDLLDSALQDMTKKEAVKEETSATNAGTSELVDDFMNGDFIKEAAAQFESNINAILGNVNGRPEDQIPHDQITATFAKMAEAASHVMKTGKFAPRNPETTANSTEAGKVDEVSAAISETLQNLNTNTENLQQPFTDQDLANMFGNLNFPEGEFPDEPNMFVPFMQGMMQSLLSKDVLYPSLKDLVDRYPAWLTENKGKIEQKEYERFEQQEVLMKQVCAELETEQASDPEDVKKQRFEKVLDLMQKMQDLGQPPSELVGDVALSPNGIVQPTAEELSQCSLM